MTSSRGLLWRFLILAMVSSCIAVTGGHLDTAVSCAIHRLVSYASAKTCSQKIPMAVNIYPI